ncbi:hypothetical protein AJ85_17250 [Alkalihalobacillus alcalophilus ATCC 27647 = CGMCC 1.3604]|uniref:IDEAL domain-containing protein n=2 Tax=Alkalihalobacillus alcalophilus ATCC 27647 = CGMCC 1.3604 TaxID=1218173 RepID=A0A4S4K7K8_ALKAL|nr:hypothetical protein [Alkalihalobacillus alcalophilus]MED1563976.1 hypothetical protein [Alkalihalobacillus alcalophilus]THG92109.1 hypothetical protein AJ85_17250 [Alkalihalobacillus alcalophilus ATCC 27647 = CGMCC 1.3604]
MNDYKMSMKKVWKDIDFFQVKLLLKNSDIQLNLKLYTDNEELYELQRGIKIFIEKLGKDDYYWCTGSLEATHFLSLRFYLIDVLGRIAIEVNVNNNLEIPEQIKAQFYLTTEFNQLDYMILELERFIKEEQDEWKGLIL